MSNFSKAFLLTSILYVVCFSIYMYSTFKESKNILKKQSINKISFNVIEKKQISKKQEENINAQEIKQEEIKYKKEIVKNKPNTLKKIVKKIKKEPLKYNQKEVVKKENKKEKQKIVVNKQIFKDISKNTVEVNQVNLQAIKEQFFYDLRNKIEEKKVYPKRARERNIEDNCKVSFQISQSGLISKLEIQGKKIFKRSIENSINECFPLKIPKELKEFPIMVNLTLKYKLN